MLTVEVQYISICPIVNEMIANANSAISQLDFEVNFIKTQLARDLDIEKYKGCPTILVEGRDYEGKIKYENGKPFCRQYRNGVPSVEQLKTFILCNY